MQARYVTVPGVEARAVKLFAALAEGSEGARLVPAEGTPPPFERCAETAAARMYRIDSECIRALVPEVPGQPPTVALAVVENRRPNITGRIVLKGHTIYCIGARAVGFEDLNDPLDSLSPGVGVEASIDQCIAEALSTERSGAMRRGRDGTPLWRFPFTPDRLAETAQAARGSAHGIATIRVQSISLEPDGSCTIGASVEQVEHGPALRRGDVVEIAWPGSCTEAHPMSAPLATRGGLFRFYGAWGGGVRYIEPLITPTE